MYYPFNITIPKNTSQENPYQKRIKLGYGVLCLFRLQIPSGCAGKTGLRVLHMLNQIFPASQNEYFTGDNSVYEFKEAYPLLRQENELVIEAWNTSETYDHLNIVSFLVLPLEVIYPLLYTTKGRLKDILKRR